MTLPWDLPPEAQWRLIIGILTLFLALLMVYGWYTLAFTDRFQRESSKHD